MTALAASRNTVPVGNETPSSYVIGVKGSTIVYAGLIAVLSSGYLANASTATGLVCVGRFEATVDNSAGADGDVTAEVRPGSYYFSNSSAGDQITAADRGQICYLVDDNTVAKTSNNGARSRAGIVLDVDATLGVLVFMSPVLAGILTLGQQLEGLGTLKKLQSGRGSLTSGAATITGVTLTATSRIVVTMADPGAGAITGMAGFDVPDASRNTGTGQFVVNAIDDSKAVIATAACTFDYFIIG